MNGAPKQSAVSRSVCLVGFVTEVSESGAPIVTFPGCPEGGLEARLIAGALPDGVSRSPVALLLTDEGAPIILGAVVDTVMVPSKRVEPGGSGIAELLLPAPNSIHVDDKGIVIEAQREIVLRCGESSITLRKDGKIVVRGRQLLSRASQTNRIQGGSVFIN